MKMSDGEKLIAYMIADLAEALKAKGEIDASFIKTVIAGDDLWALKYKYNSLFHSEGPNGEIVEETTKIMAMCRVVENSIARFSQSDREAIDDIDRQVFIGFDGNEEPHYGVARMLIEELDRFAEWKTRSLNSHHNTLDRYRRMRRIFDAKPRDNRGLLDLAAVQAVLAADGY